MPIVVLAPINFMANFCPDRVLCNVHAYDPVGVACEASSMSRTHAVSPSKPYRLVAATRHRMQSPMAALLTLHVWMFASFFAPPTTPVYSGCCHHFHQCCPIHVCPKNSLCLSQIPDLPLRMTFLPFSTHKPFNSPHHSLCLLNRTISLHMQTFHKFQCMNVALNFDSYQASCPSASNK